MDKGKRLEIINRLKDCGFDYEQIKEIIQETRYAILDYLDGSIEYCSIDNIMQEFLGFGDDYLDALFIIE